MRPRADFSERSIFHLFTLCGRADRNAAQLQQIAQVAAQITNWTNVPGLAEAHGIAPLLYHHVTNAGFALPINTKRELYALVVRHRLANQTRTHVLREILIAFQSTNILVFVLKGAALAHWLYPEPGLRPMRDLDLLVKPLDAARAQSVLSELEFDAPSPKTPRDFAHRHLHEATKGVDGFTVTIEIHHQLFEKGSAPRLMSIGDLTGMPITIVIDDLITQTLGYEDTLWYLCQHLIESTNVFSSVGLIWVADVVNFAERFATEIDWKQIQSRYPLVLDTLSLVHWLMPLSDNLLARAPVVLGRAPQGMWRDFQKLPRTTPEEQIQKGIAQTLRDAMFPTEWWLRLYFGLGSARPLRWYHKTQHALYLAHRLAHVLQRRTRQKYHVPKKDQHQIG